MNASPNIFAYTVNSTNGGITLLPDSPFVAPGLPSTEGLNSAAVEPTGRILYAVFSRGSQVFEFSINPTTGALTEVRTTATPRGPSTIDFVK